MQLTTNSSVSPRISGTDQHKRRRTSALLLTPDDHIDDAIAIASIRENVASLGSIVSEDSDSQAGKPVLSARLNGNPLRAKWPGKRWHGKYRDIDEVCDAAHGLESFMIDYVDAEDLRECFVQKPEIDGLRVKMR